MRQLKGMLQTINKAHLVEFYNDILSYGTVHGAKLPSLEEFLAASLNESAESVSSFDQSTEEKLEALALKRLEEQRAEHERRLINKN